MIDLAHTAAADTPLLPAVERTTGESPECAIVWLHGLGADGHDFEPIVDEFDFDQLPAVRFVFPHAPMRAVTINGGFVMRAWYDIVSPDFAPGREEGEHVRESTRQVEALLARENSRGIPDERIVLAGFSQGGVIALHCGLRHSRRLAGILALSCYLPQADTLADEAQAANGDVPIFMAHGRADPVIPYDLGKQSAKLLQARGYPLQWRGYATAHSVCLEELEDIGGWLNQVLAATF
ncbi:MAG: Carboxylesterase 2 [Candidatus Accumulibacter adjunctus]|uniref:Carboxylesterase 2 n=1 Tax=Candidatus Accumulibacter adjunctus TaxID=1454001 RepID=A0A011NTI4_9PROT|nr:MAG: Carboxylesterase 2 [Candidatus Accumulibacter adjunctus]